METLALYVLVMFVAILIVPLLLVAALAMSCFGIAACAGVHRLVTEPRYLIKLERERHPQFGPFRTFAAEEGYAKVSLLPMIYASVGPLLEKLDAAVVSRLDRVERACCEAWHSKPGQLIGRLSLTSTALLGIFWGSAYLFGNEPAQVTSIGCAFYSWPLVEGLAISRMWDALLAPVAVTLSVGAVWVAGRYVFDVDGIFDENPRPVFFGYGLIAVGLGLFAYPGLAESHILRSLLGLIPLAGFEFLAIIAVCGFFIEVVGSAMAFRQAGCSNILKNVNCYRTGLILFCMCAVAGIFGGLFFWGLPIGLAIGIGSGIAIGGFVTCCAHLTALVVRLAMLTPRFLRWQFAANID